jgi:hypothetical protein
LGFAINRVRSFDRVFRYETEGPFPIRAGEDENGSLWAWSFGGGIEVSPKASIGLSIDIFDGTDNYSYFEDSYGPSDESINYTQNIIDEYTGISGKVGAVYQASNALSVGVVIGFPTSMSIDQTADEYLEGPGAYESHTAFSYRYTLPFSFGLGASLAIADLTLAGDIGYFDYSQLKYRSGFDDQARANLTVKEYYDDVLNYYLGAEYLVRAADLRLRGGYFSQPIPYNYFPSESEPHFFTIGAGLLVERTFNIDMAYLLGNYKREDPGIGSFEDYDVQRFLLTVSYRIK